MFTKVKTKSSNPNDVTEQLHMLLKNLSSPSTEPGKLLNWLRETKQLLSCILIGTIDYDVAHSRIRNSIRYLESCELGAAKYEIRLLLGGLRSQLQLGDRNFQSTPVIHRLHDQTSP